MSNQAKVGRTLMDVRDVCKSRLTQKLIQLNESLSLNLSSETIKELSDQLNGEVHTSFENGLDAVIRVL